MQGIFRFLSRQLFRLGRNFIAEKEQKLYDIEKDELTDREHLDQ